ncbi:MAG: GGDEF domain-containing protein [Gammaproteobacteria bacterium]|nr:GGDEF domain-containing protein [Gammaproteobacteria bacterium]
MQKESIAINASSEFSQNDHLEAAQYPENDDSVQQEIYLALRSQYLLWRFPARLESAFLDQHTICAIQSLHFRAPLLFFLFFVENFAIYQVLPKEVYSQFFSINIWTFCVILTVFVLSYVSALRRWYEWYVGIGGVAAIATSTACANIAVGESAILTYAGIIYIVIVIYSFVSLRFQSTMVVGWLGSLAGITLAYAIGQHINWKVYSLTFTMTSMLGMCIAYALDHGKRKSFLQTHLLQHLVDKEQLLAKQLYTLSRQDGLTGLANRRHLDEVMHHELNRALRNHQPLALMIIDIDFFKLYNDKFGHLAGDECLKKIANLMSSLTKRSGEVAARYGGEEFVLLFPCMNATSAEQLAERLLNSLAQLKIPNPDENHPFVTVSVGIGILDPNMIMCVEQLLSQADAALYKAKDNGRNRYEIFGTSMCSDYEVSDDSPELNKTII